jgi:excinuclease ABC subunit C
MKFDDILKKLPNESGVYIYKDTNDTVIYVGKAKNLKNRVRSYFHSNDLNYKTRMLVSAIADINYIVTANELEALLLENNLIKKHKPKYNILLKDDKGYPYLRIDPKSSFPMLELARKMTFDGALYFGPYHGAGSAKAISEIATEVFPLKTCSYDLIKNRNIRPCLKYHINRCPAPCVNHDRALYKKNVDGIISFLKGNQNIVLDTIRQKMESASEKLEFEHAAELRDKLFKTEEILNKQKIVLDKNQNIDVVSVLLRDTFAVICSLYVRSGRLIGVNTIEISDLADIESESALLAKYLIRHYTDGEYIPTEIVCDVTPDDKDFIEEIIFEQTGRKTHIHLAMRGKKHELCLMAKRNAREKMEKSSTSLSYRDERIIKGLENLKNYFVLSTLPHRIECFDISHIQGTDTVASMVVFTNGKPDRKEYRRFNTHQGNNDYASMQEVVSRRYNDLLNGKKGFDKAPDLIVIDGGKGQLSSSIEIIRDALNITTKTIGLAEKLEEIFLTDSPVPLILERSDPALQILQAIRDEAHRFAITFHRSLRKKGSLLSVLDTIEGIGPKRKKALLKAFGAVARIKDATLEELESIDGMNKNSAQTVYDHFKKDNSVNQ